MPNFSQLSHLIEKYFPELAADAQRMGQMKLAFDAYVEWNPRVNVVSRKDIENLAERHFLHSLAIAKGIDFKPGTTVLDAGTGGGFPGIPLAIYFPETNFHLVDSRGKKISVVQEIVQEAGLENVQTSVQRVEQLPGQYDFVVSRAVAAMEKFIPWVRKRIHCRSQHEIPNGILYLRGGDIEAEMQALKEKKMDWTVTPLPSFFEEEFFSSKSLLQVSFC